MKNEGDEAMMTWNDIKNEEKIRFNVKNNNFY